MRLVYNVYDDENQIESKQFDNFPEALEYAKQGLITYICEEDLDCPECEERVVWTWDSTWDDEEAISNVEGEKQEIEPCVEDNNNIEITVSGPVEEVESLVDLVFDSVFDLDWDSPVEETKAEEQDFVDDFGYEDEPADKDLDFDVENPFENDLYNLEKNLGEDDLEIGEPEIIVDPVEESEENQSKKLVEEAEEDLEEVDEEEIEDEAEEILTSVEEIKEIAAEAGEAIASVYEDKPMLEHEDIKEITDEVVENKLEEQSEDELSDEELEELDEELEGTDNAVIDCKVADVVAHSEDEKPVDCKMEKAPLEKPLTEEIDLIRAAAQCSRKCYDLYRAIADKAPDKELKKQGKVAYKFVKDQYGLTGQAAEDLLLKGYALWKSLNESLDHKGLTSEQLSDIENYLKTVGDLYLEDYEQEYDFAIDIVGGTLTYNEKTNNFDFYLSIYHASEDNNAENVDYHTDEEEYSFDNIEEVYDEFPRYLEDIYKWNASKISKMEEAIQITRDELMDKEGTTDVDLINAGRPEEERVELEEGRQPVYNIVIFYYYDKDNNENTITKSNIVPKDIRAEVDNLIKCGAKRVYVDAKINGEWNPLDKYTYDPVWLPGTPEYAARNGKDFALAESISQEISRAYKQLSKEYGRDIEELVYGPNGFMATKYPNGLPDFSGDIIYSDKYWTEFEEWLEAQDQIEEDLEDDLTDQEFAEQLQARLKEANVNSTIKRPAAPKDLSVVKEPGDPSISEGDLIWFDNHKGEDIVVQIIQFTKNPEGKRTGCKFVYTDPKITRPHKDTYKSQYFGNK